MTAAVAHHQGGRLQEAEKIYRDILVVLPNHADALHLLGVAAHQKGRHEEALAHIGRAIRLLGTEASFHNNLGEAYRALGKLAEAESAYRRALELKADYAEAHHNLGLVLAKQGRPQEAETSFRRSLELRPKNAETQHGLSLALLAYGRLDEGIAGLRQALEWRPDYAAALISLGHVLREQRQLEEAADCYQRAARLQADDAGLHVQLGHVLMTLDRLDEAVASFRRGLGLKPDDPSLHNDLAVALIDQGRLDEAIAGFRRALHLKPDYAGAHSNLGIALSLRGQLDDAMASYRRALELDPGFVMAHVNVGNALRDRGQLDEAAASYQRALQLKPDEPAALGHLGSARKDQGRLEEAVACYRRALEINPTDRGTHSSLLFTLMFCPDFDARALYEENREWDRRHAQPLAKFIQPHTNDRSPDRRLRVGYVSPDFRNHVEAFFIVPLMGAHDHRNYQICCYSDVISPDNLTARIRAHADVWHDITGLTDERLAQQVREDRIDILVDTTMHMSRTRLLAFARKPAPVQVTWLAYPGTTGLSAMDYRLTDPHLDPPGMFDDCYSEESVRLPDSFWCYDPLTTEATLNPLPATEKGYVTFGNLNNFCKINVGVLKLWAEVMRAVEGSRLILLAGEGSHRQDTVEVMRKEGIAPERVQILGRRPRGHYLELYHQIDLGIDTLPYNGHTTSLDSYWMGVPVVTLVGQTVVGRAGLSQLRNLELPELIAETPEQFIRITVELANDLPRLSKLRASLRERMRASPLMDGPRFARNLEAAYRSLWQRWCSS